jgi:hypothetical protein
VLGIFACGVRCQPFANQPPSTSLEYLPCLYRGLAIPRRLLPPCIRQRPFAIGAFWHKPPARVLALHVAEPKSFLISLTVNTPCIVSNPMQALQDSTTRIPLARGCIRLHQILNPKAHAPCSAIVGLNECPPTCRDRLVARINRQGMCIHQAHDRIKLHCGVLVLAAQNQCAGRQMRRVWVALHDSTFPCTFTCWPPGRLIFTCGAGRLSSRRTRAS